MLKDKNGVDVKQQQIFVTKIFAGQKRCNIFRSRGRNQELAFQRNFFVGKKRGKLNLTPQTKITI
eukprot:UN27822